MATPASSDELVLAVGRDDVLDRNGEEAFAVTVEYRSAPFIRINRFDLSWLLAAQADEHRELFLGAGVNVYTEFGNGPLFAECSAALGPFFQPGLSLKDPDDFLIRTSLGVGFRLSETKKVSLSIDHLLNTELQNYNPGSEAVMLRYGFRF